VSDVIKKAREHLFEICKDMNKFRMSIPVREDDSDMIIDRALDHAEKTQILLKKAVEVIKKDQAEYGKCEMSIFLEDHKEELEGLE